MKIGCFGLSILSGTVPALHGVAAQSNWYIGASAEAALISDFSRSTRFFDAGELQAPGTNTTTYDLGAAVDLSLG